MSGGDPFVSIFHDWIGLFMHRSMRGHILYARKKGLSRSMLGTLYFLKHKGISGVSDLGSHLGVSNPAASQMLERLVEEGLIQRSEDPEDRRMKRISLTEKGSSVIKESINARLEWIEDLASVLTTEERNQVIAAMQLMVAKVPKLAHDHNDQDPI
jgi:DNA-binding MarR family transcriptional regulator